jgi:hypothetical protein
MAKQEVFWPDLVPIRDQIPAARINTFWVSEIQGNPYAVKATFKPISVGEVISFLEKPIGRRTEFGDRNADIMQNVVYPDWYLERGPISQDIPDGLYEWVYGAQVTSENIRERILEIKERGGEKYLTALQKYFIEVKGLGEEMDISNANFAIDVTSLSTDFHIQGEKDDQGVKLQRSTVRISGQFNEVRSGEEKDTIVRIRKKSGEPTVYDALNLAVNYFAYSAHLASTGEERPEPRFMVFNLAEGKMYIMKILSGKFYKEIGNAIFLTYLARQAGYVPDFSPSGITEIDIKSAKSHERNVEIKKGKKKEVTLSASDTFHKAENCINRLIGKLPHTNQQFRFIRVVEEEY